MHAKRDVGSGGERSERCTSVDPRCEIVEYLGTHPSAADSLEGIVDWWLPRQRFETAKGAIQNALDNLESQGVVELVTMSDGVRLYRLASKGVQKG